MNVYDFINKSKEGQRWKYKFENNDFFEFIITKRSKDFFTYKVLFTNCSAFPLNYEGKWCSLSLIYNIDGDWLILDHK